MEKAVAISVPKGRIVEESIAKLKTMTPSKHKAYWKRVVDLFDDEMNSCKKLGE